MKPGDRIPFELAVTDDALLIVSSTGNTVPSVTVAYGTLRLGANNALPTGTDFVLGQAILDKDYGTFDLGVGVLFYGGGAPTTFNNYGAFAANSSGGPFDPRQINVL